MPPYLDAHLLEFDGRFAVFGAAFTHYDFNAPLDLPSAARGACDIICLDPPFLNAECLRAFARTAFALRRDNSVRIILCTGAIMLREARRLLGVRPRCFEVHHSARLSNPFACFTNYDDEGRLGGLDVDAEEAETE